MSREIKFRAWHTVNKVMMDNKSIPVLAKNIKDDNIWKYMQWTGLKDKNGVDLYEGDICRFHEDKEESIFFHGLAYINNDRVGGSWKIIECGNDLGKEGLDSSSFWNDDYEVIGNIYENPDLLK